MQKWKRCPLTLRFGHDVANMINMIVWSSKMKCVNVQYDSIVIWTEKPDFFFIKGQNYAFNARSVDFKSWIRHHYINARHDETDRLVHIVANLPTHYWRIKELY